MTNDSSLPPTKGFVFVPAPRYRALARTKGTPSGLTTGIRKTGIVQLIYIYTSLAHVFRTGENIDFRGGQYRTGTFVKDWPMELSLGGFEWGGLSSWEKVERCGRESWSR